jgi:hypothetical protein
MALHHNPRIVTDGLLVGIDPGDINSYPGQGTSASSLVGGYTATMANQLQYEDRNSGVFLSDGTGDSLIIPHSTDFNLTTVTLEAFIWWDQHKNYGSLLVKGPGGSGQLFNYSFFFYETNIRFGIGNGSSYVYVTINVTDLPISTWHHIVGTYDLSAMKFYLNGALKVQSSQNFTPNQNTDDLQVLQSLYNLDGYLGPVRLYNRALTASEVLQNYNATKTRFGL